MNPLASFNRLVESAISAKDGQKLRFILKCDQREAVDAINHFYNHGGPLPRPMPAPWNTLPDFVEKLFAAAGALNLNHWVDAYEHQSQALHIYLSILANDTDWSLPLFHHLTSSLRIIAESADAQLRVQGHKPCKLEAAERFLKRGFTVTNNDRRPVGDGSRRLGTLGAINQLLKIYFKLNNLRMCGNLTRTVATPSFPSFDLFPQQHRVTYKYYAGRLFLYEGKYTDAVTDLSYALKHTPEACFKHRCRILLYLVPAKILTGSLPSEKTMEYFEMSMFRDISVAIKTGNLSLFKSAVARHEEFFIQSALYLAIEKMRPLVYRSFFRKVAMITQSNKISLKLIVTCLATCEVHMSVDEVECILANLIFHNYIKGYISHKVGYLVLSKKNPFPQLHANSLEQ